MSCTIEMKGVKKNFGNNYVLKGLDLNIPKGSIYALLGHNGAGKTTTCRIIQGLYSVDGGSVKTFGKDPIKNNKELSYRIGVLSEDIGLYENLTIDENLYFFGSLYNIDKELLKKRVEDLKEYFDLHTKGDSIVNTLSRGMKKKVSLLKTIIHQPELLILDEPLNGLDPIMSEKFCDLIKQLKIKQGMTVILTSHHLDEVEKIIDNYSIIKNGRCVEIEKDTSNYLKYQIYISEDSVARINNLHEFISVFNFNITDSRIELVVKNTKEMNTAIQQLIGRGITIEEIRKVEKSLKEVYINYGN